MLLMFANDGYEMQYRQQDQIITCGCKVTSSYSQSVVSQLPTEQLGFVPTKNPENPDQFQILKKNRCK